MSYLLILPHDLIQSLFLYFSVADLLDIIPELHNLKILLDIYSWKVVWNRDISSLIELPVGYDPYKIYNGIFKELNGFSKCADKIDHSIKKGYDKLLYPLLTNTISHNYAMKMAAEEGHIEIVKYCIDHGATFYNLAMIAAASANHIEIVKLMIDKGADEFNDAMAFASLFKGSMAIIDLMVENGAIRYDWALKHAASAKRFDVVEKMWQLIDQNKEKYSEDQLEYFRAIAMNHKK